MAGGLLNLIAIGNTNIILTGNPTKSFFKSSYSKYTNFGLQKFRIDQRGQTNLSVSKDTTYKFKINRYGDLLMDTYLVIKLPKIWSPILKYTKYNNNNDYRPYEFKWINNIGTNIIKEINFSIGGRSIQKFSGNYIQSIVERDFSSQKKKLFDIMIGNVAEINDPANYSNRNNNYPNAFKISDTSLNNVEHSIDEYILYIPINIWFTLLNTMALPLICLQYAELEIDFTLRPLEELFTIKDVLTDISFDNITNYDNISRRKPNQNENFAYNIKFFLQEPIKKDISLNAINTIYDISSTFKIPDFDIHLITTQCFLDNEERSLFANNNQIYLIKQVREYNFEKINKSSKIKLESNGQVSNWMFYFQRNDVKDRNEWSNYSNWPYDNIIPNSMEKLKINDNLIYYNLNNSYNIDDLSKNIYITGYTPESNEQQNFYSILKDFAIIIDGKYRENSLPAGIYEKIEKYTRTSGNSKQGLYHYNFTLNSDSSKYQPMGAFNTNKFKTIEFEYNLTSNPPIDLSNVNVSQICDPITREVIATSKEPTSIYQYNYNLYIMEECYNILLFQSGTADLVYGR